MDDQTIGRSERNELARRYVDSAESWLRRIIDYRLSTTSGTSYITAGNWKRNLIEHVVGKKALYPGKFPREIDATTFEQAIGILCHPDVWNSHFKEVFKTAYPLGAEEARQFLEALKDIRNDVSHGRSCSARQLEKTICYSNDFIDDVKAFFKGQSMQKVYNVPMIVRYSDSLGNDSDLSSLTTDIAYRVLDWRPGSGDLHPGQHFSAEIEVDPNFPESEYSVTWTFGSSTNGTGRIARVVLLPKHANELTGITFTVVSNKEWHRRGSKDDEITCMYRVLPPLDR